MDFNLEPTPTAKWYSLVGEAMQRTGHPIESILENYLVLTLDHFMTENNLAQVVLALGYLTGVEHLGRQGAADLRRVGDQCLLLSGLFPERALRKNVSLGYFIGLGKEAYGQLAGLHYQTSYDPDLFNKLSRHFVGLMDVLHAMRNLSIQKKFHH